MRTLCLSLVLQFFLIQLSALRAGNVSTNSKPAGPIPLKAEGIDNFFKLSDRYYSGAAPEGDAGFLALQKLGIKTVITVDGSKPNVDLAHKYGLRYVHLPHGYNGIRKEVQLELIKAAETLPGPIFIHCHHGKHRGPVAAAVICMAEENWDSAKALEWLKTAGTATNYVGLFKTVREFEDPSPAELARVSTTFPELAQTAHYVDAMVAVDEQWDHLKEVRKAGYAAPKDHPDIDPANEAVILWERFREAQRLSDAQKHGEVFLGKLKEAENEARDLEQLFRALKKEDNASIRVELDKAMDGIAQSCANCHKSYRDPALAKP
jgi:hypothetical protein